MTEEITSKCHLKDDCKYYDEDCELMDKSVPGEPRFCHEPKDSANHEST